MVQDRYIIISKPEDVDKYSGEDIYGFDPVQLKTWSRHGGLVVMNEDQGHFPWSYYQALRKMLERKGLTWMQFLTQMLLREVETNVDPDVKVECGILPLSKEERDYLMSYNNSDSEWGIIGTWSLEDENGNIEIIMKQDEQEYKGDHPDRQSYDAWKASQASNKAGQQGE